MNKATRSLAMVLAILAGVMGIEHGLGETLQGYRPTEGVFILSWPDSGFFEIMSGEPAMTIVPNYLLTGILAILFSALFLAGVIGFQLKRKSLPIMGALIVLMLLTGGGFGPPILGTIAVLIALKRDVQLRAWQKLPATIHRVFKRLWPWAFGLTLLGWLMLFPGANLISYFGGVESEWVMIVPLLVAFGMIPVTLVMGFSRDLLARDTKP
jgi:hypothetical protein